MIRNGWRRIAAAGWACVLASCGGGSGSSQEAGTAGLGGNVQTRTTDLALTASMSASAVGQGQAVQLDIVVSNISDFLTEKPLLSAGLMPGMTLQSANCEAAGGAVCPAEGTFPQFGLVTLPVMPAHSSLTMHLLLEIDSAADLSIYPNVDAYLDSDPADNVAALTLHVRAPQRLAPEDAWRPVDSYPVAGNFVELDSQAGDPIGGGSAAVIGSANGAVDVVASANSLVTVDVGGATPWTGRFQGMPGMPRLLAGYYAPLRAWPSADPEDASMDWRGGGRACTAIAGWFLVDKAVYDGDTLTALDLRFEQRCDGATAALHGAIHWIR